MFNQILGFTDHYLKMDTEFWKNHGSFLEQNKRGYGYWLWKSYINYKLSCYQLEENDIVVYLDAGCKININQVSLKRIQDYIDIVRNSHYGILSFSLPGTSEQSYTKMDCIKYFDFENSQESEQLVGGIFIYRICKHTQEIMSEWYKSCCNYHLLNDDPSVSPNYSGFYEHRHDQSIFSIIRKRKGTEILSDETYWYPDWEIKGKSYPFWALRNKNKQSINKISIKNKLVF